MPSHSLKLFLELGVVHKCEIDPTLIVPYVQISPLDMVDDDSLETCGNKNWSSIPLWVVTDWHPDVLASTTVSNDEHTESGAVMYVGPDSLALVRHLPLAIRALEYKKTVRILDLCTGSGVQALSATALWLSQQRKRQQLEQQQQQTQGVVVKVEVDVTCVDVNARALQFTEFNFALNGLLLGGDHDSGNDDAVVRLTTQQADLLSSEDECFWQDWTAQPVDLLTANPPFVPLPLPDDTDSLVNANADESQSQSQSHYFNTRRRYGLFSAVGPRGDEVLKRIVSHAPHVLAEDGGHLMVVSEFMNPPTSSFPSLPDGNNDDVADLIEQWWDPPTTPTHESASSTSETVGVLFTNEQPVSAETYAMRRAFSTTDKDRDRDRDNEQVRIWRNHLQGQDIQAVSPGLLFVQTRKGTERAIAAGTKQYLRLHRSIVPKTDLGSLWTPHNVHAHAFVRQRWQECTSTTAPATTTCTDGTGCDDDKKDTS